MSLKNRSGSGRDPIQQWCSRPDKRVMPAEPVPPVTCLWIEDVDDCFWTTACGETWCFEYGGTPLEHHMRFCHACGKPLAITLEPPQCPSSASSAF